MVIDCALFSSSSQSNDQTSRVLRNFEKDYFFCLSIVRKEQSNVCVYVYVNPLCVHVQYSGLDFFLLSLFDDTACLKPSCDENHFMLHTSFSPNHVEV